MLRYALLTCLWSIANARYLTDWLTAPELVDNTVARVLYKEIRDKSPHELIVRVETIELHASSPAATQCNFSLTAEPDSVAMNITTFRRVGDDRVLLVSYYEQSYGRNRYTKITLLNTNTCSRNDILLIRGNPIAVPSADTVDVFHNAGCNKLFSRCRYSFPVKSLGTPTINAFDVDLDWSTMRIERLPSKDFVVRGFQGDLYKVMRMSHSGAELRDLILVPSIDRQLEMRSTGLTFCWIYNPGHDKTVSCRQFNGKNELIYSVDTTFDQPMTILRVESRFEGTIGFFAAKAHCTDKQDCWGFRMKNFYQFNQEPDPDESLQFSCPGLNRKYWMTFGNNGVHNSFSLCTLSGDTLANDPEECHRDANDRLYCIKSCTRL